MNRKKWMMSGMVGMAAAAWLIGPATAQAAITELPGNLFHQYNAAQDPNVGIAINNPQNMGGGGGVFGSNYPVGGDSPVLDGSDSTGWGSGQFTDGGMCNVGITQGAFNSDASSFSFTPFGTITTIRIIAQNYINSDTTAWVNFPDQIKVGYSTSTSFNVGNGYTYNSNTLGILPATWGNDVTILTVNGVAATSETYGSGTGWVSLDGLFTGLYAVNEHETRGYIDLGVLIPAGATSIMVSFGQSPSSQSHQLSIQEIQAYNIPEPASVMLMGCGGLVALRRRGSKTH